MRESILDQYRATAIGALMTCAAAFGFSHVAHAESVYKCRSADNMIAFQDHPCLGTEAESRVEMQPAPPVTASPDYGRASQDEDAPHAHALPRVRGRSADRREPMSYECRAANGDVFYRHGSCPKQITDGGASTKGRARLGNTASTFAVSGQALPRSEACRRMADTGRSDRKSDG